MQSIIYKSQAIIPWDTQSAFKMNSYKTEKEENRIFCYLKQYVHGDDLVVCTYCFKEKPEGKNDLSLVVNLGPETGEKYLYVDFGFDGIGKVSFKNGEQTQELFSDILRFTTFKADDEQGFYWCGELTFSKSFILQFFNRELQEGSLVTLNLRQNFEGTDFACLFGNADCENYSLEGNMGVFVILNY